MSSMQSQKEQKPRRDRIAVLREQVACFKEEIESIKERERSLESAKEQLRTLNKHLIQRLKNETNTCFSVNQAFQTFQACLEAEKQKELVQLALKRSVSSKFNNLQVQNQKAPPSISSEWILTCSMASIKEDVPEQDSGLEINEMQGLKDENQELKLENGKLQSELLSMKKMIENQTAMMEEREGEFNLSKQTWKMFDEQSSLLAIELQELSETKATLEEELELRGKQLEELKVKNAEMIKEMKENHNIEMKNKAINIERLEELAVTLKKNNEEMKEGLRHKDLYLQAKEIESDALLQAMRTTFEEEIGKAGKDKENLVNELTNLKEKVNVETAKIDENAKELAAIEEKCEMLASKKSLMAVQLRDVSTARGQLENELALKCKELRDMESTRHDEIKKMKEEHNTEMAKKIKNVECLQKELSKCHEDYAIIKKALEDKEMEVQLKEMVKEAIFGAMENTYAVDTEKYQKVIQEMQKKMSNIEKWKITHIEKEQLMTYELEKVKQEVLDLRNAKDESDKANSLLAYKIDELTAQKVEALAKFGGEHDRLTNNNNSLKEELKSAKRACVRLEECNSNVEKAAEELKMELKSERSRATELEREVFMLHERLSEKETKIEHFLNAKSKKRGIRRFISCGR